MDPQETWNRLLDAWKCHDWEELESAAKGLKSWMQRGGFPPEVVPSRTMGALWNRALARAACVNGGEKVQRLAGSGWR